MIGVELQAFPRRRTIAEGSEAGTEAGSTPLSQLVANVNNTRFVWARHRFLPGILLTVSKTPCMAEWRYLLSHYRLESVTPLYSYDLRRRSQPVCLCDLDQLLSNPQ